ncbi:hypothetical protein B0H14DRAFT_3518589 [Mycena olivaceomarginata]|nr:hypothetical protein B0H14DRAFT_3518589 [Mycena olivaceomarginata]
MTSPLLNWGRYVYSMVCATDLAFLKLFQGDLTLIALDIYTLANVFTHGWYANLRLKGFVFFLWFLAPVLYFPNTWFGNFLLISSRTSYDNQMKSYDVSKILTANNTVDLDTYHAYSPLFISMMFAVSYGYNIFAIVSNLLCYKAFIRLDHRSVCYLDARLLHFRK